MGMEMGDGGELERLRRENAQLRALITHLPVAAVVFETPHFRVELVNETYEAMIGQRDVVGKTLAEIHPGVSAESILGYLDDVYRHKVPRVRREHPRRLPGADGVLEERFFTNTFQPLFDEGGHVRSVVATVIEVTTEVRARQAVAAAASRLRVILDELPVGVIVRDGTTSAVLLTNKASADILGLDVMALGSSDPLRTEEAVKNKTLFLRRADTGAAITLRSSAATIKGHGDQPLVVSVFEDITEEERLLAEREQTVRFAEMFIGVLGHDLRNPLNAITMGAQLLERRGALDAADGRRVRQIGASAQRMARMVDQLLDMTRARLGGGIAIQRARTDLVAVAAHVLDELATAHPAVALRRTLPGTLVGKWDGDRLAQVVSNLVGNAIEHGDRAHPVTVTLVGSADAVTLAVHNHGRAIPDDLLPTLFDPFRRGTRPPNAKTTGLGLGLYITREIAVAHGGRVGVTSSTVEGTCFTVTLPAINSDGDADAAT